MADNVRVSKYGKPLFHTMCRSFPATFVCAMLVACLPAMAQVPPPLPDVANHLDLPDRYPSDEITFANGVRGVPGVVYAEPIGYRQLTLDLYLPAKSAERPSTGFPLVVYVHGGAWLSGNSRRLRPFANFPGVLASLSSKGYVVASVEYRLSSEAKFPAQIQDVKAAIRWLRSNSATYDVDPARVITWGVSSGAHLAALAAVSCNVLSLEPAKPRGNYSPDAASAATLAPASDCVQGSVAWYGVFDMSTIASQAIKRKAMSREEPDAPEWQLLGCFANACKPEQMAAASPVTYVNAKSPPMLLIVGNDDRLVPYDQSLEMAETLKAANVQHQLIVLTGEDHSFMGKTSDQTRDANIRALQATFAFIDRIVGSTSAATGF
jgi:acetyl esterase/lipase